MKISELFYSIQGEGKLIGLPSVFVRASGCNLRCTWCFDPSTPILRPDWTWTSIGAIRAGDEVIARTLPQDARHGSLVITRVLRVARRRAPLVRVNDEITCTPDHRFWLTGRDGARSGWREISRCRGLSVSHLAPPAARQQADYEIGYLAGMADGDGCFWTLRHRRGYRRFRLALTNADLLDRFASFAGRAAFTLRRGAHDHNGYAGQQVLPALWLTSDAAACEFERRLKRDGDNESWRWGYVAGMLDAEGSIGGRALRISQDATASERTYARLCHVLDQLRLKYSREVKAVHLHSSEGQLWRILIGATPAKHSICAAATGRAPNHGRVIDTVEPFQREGDVITLTTDCGSYVAGGYIVKNCDTPYASWNPEGDDLPVDEIVRRVSQYGEADATPKHVVLTGGEPMIMPDVVALCDALKARGHHITIETAATVYKSGVKVDLASLSPKLSNSTPWEREGGRFAAAHERQRINVPVIQQFIDAAPDFQLKFVVSDERDLSEIEQLLSQLKNWTPADVLLMPEGTDAATLSSRAGWMADVCKRTGFRSCPRLHVELYGNTRGT